MTDLLIRPYSAGDEAAILDLNKHSVHFLSPMDKSRFAELRAMARLLWLAESRGEVVAFLLGFSEGAAYDSVNYRWFSRRLKNFFYIDRIVVSDKVRSLGVGRSIYAKLESWALQQGFDWLAAEVDIEPPNTGSLRFHDRQQFVEVARQTAGVQRKTVSLRIKCIGAHP